MLDWNRLENGFERLLELLNHDPRVLAEFEASRALFFVDGEGARRAQAERRHLEWFMLERPCEALGAVPAVAWQEPWSALVGEPVEELASALLESVPGAFEVTSVVSGEGFWVRDLFTGGEHPVAEARVAGSFAAGDLLVGRLYPTESGVYFVSPAVTLFRSAPLLAAVRRDLEGMRRARRGVLRIQQLELEHLFHTGALAESARPKPAEGRARAREALAAMGLETRAIERVLARVARGARAGDARTVTEVMNELAFETPVELASARLVLAELWDIERAALAGDPGASSAGADAEAALAAFDEGRARGKDLESLFHELERSLGLEDEAEGDEEDPVAPDFPGVVGAMVEEFLWDVGREEGPERAHELEPLRLLGKYAADVGLFEELGVTRLLDFSARWLLDESGLVEEREAQRLLDALAAFCRWSEERHEVKLWSPFERDFASLRAAVARHLRLRRAAPHGPGKGVVYEVKAIADGTAMLRSRSGDEQSVPLTEAQVVELEPGDVVRLAQRGRQSFVGAGYPGALAKLVS